MKRTKMPQEDNRLQVFQSIANRMMLAKQMGMQFHGKRDIYNVLGYPDETELNFSYFYNKYERQDIASAIIDRPVDAAWDNFNTVYETESDDKFSQMFEELNERLDLKTRLSRLDKLCGIGKFGILLLGLSDVNGDADFAKPVQGRNLKLLYVKPFSEGAVTISEWETNSAKVRYGKPLEYKIDMKEPGGQDLGSLTVHYTRVIHVCEDSLLSDVYGRPRLKPIINRLVDLEKLLGGDAEMFWKGARPGYTADVKDDVDLTPDEEDKLIEQIEKYEHDLIRFITARGIDVKSLAQQVSDPLNHVEIQIQAIAAQTGIPKRILVGSERGELSSSQDKGQWLTLIQIRQGDFIEKKVLIPFINRCMELGVLPKVKDYTIEWADLFAPSDKERADVGKVRAEILKAYLTNPLALDVFPFEKMLKHLFGFEQDQVDEIMEGVALGINTEIDDMDGADDEMDEANEQNNEK